MPRPKKNYTVFNMRVDTDVLNRFKAYCDEVGQTRTLAFERIVSAYLDKYEEVFGSGGNSHPAPEKLNQY